MPEEDMQYDTKILDKLAKTFRGKLPSVKVGILGDTNNRTGEEHGPQLETNASIGAKHEFGEDGMPVRSFLRVPISDNLQKYLENSGAFDQALADKVAKEGGIWLWMEIVGKIAETIVADAFDSGGFGKWKPSNMKFKKVQQTLVETQQLRNSISSEVK